MNFILTVDIKKKELSDLEKKIGHINKHARRKDGRHLQRNMDIYIYLFIHLDFGAIFANIFIILIRKRQEIGWILGLRLIIRIWGLDLQGRVPSVLVFLRNTCPYLRQFRRTPRKITNGQVDKRDRILNLQPCTCLEGRAAWPLGGKDRGCLSGFFHVY